MKRVCVIGGAGFLGSHVADALTSAGYHVCIYDRKASAWLRDDQEMIIGDLMDVASLEAAVKGSDVVYNFAALADLT
jgi:UDP-glucose 4-epimerase